MIGDRTGILMQRLMAMGQRYAEYGWLRGTAGNLSMRHPEGDRYVITASGRQKGELRSSDFVTLKLGMKDPSPPYRRWSAETEIHDRLYRVDSDIGCVLHVHTPFVTLVSRQVTLMGDREKTLDVSGFEYVKGLDFWEPEAAVKVPVVPNHHQISRLADAVVESRTAVPGVIVQSHGAYAWGRDAKEARRHLECMERLCQLVLMEASV